MTTNEPQPLPYNPAHFGDMTTTDALNDAIVILRTAASVADPRVGAHIKRTADFLQMIDDQPGCEGFDPAVTDGQLTTLMDIIMFG